MAFQTVKATASSFSEAADLIATQLNELKVINTTVNVSEPFLDTKAGQGTFEATITILVDVEA